VVMKLLSKTLRVSVCVSLVAGCSGSGSGTTPIGTGGSSSTGLDAGSALSDFCPRLVQAMCKHIELCKCGVARVQSCENALLTGCSATNSYWASIDAAIARGNLNYRPELVDEVLAPLLSAQSTCSDIFIDLDWDSTQAYNYSGVFTGTLPADAPCSLPVSFKGGIQDCAPGLQCRAVADGDYRCAKLVPAGGVCQVGSRLSVCFESRAPDVDNEFASSFDRLSCIPDTAGVTTGTCKTQLAEGQPCQTDDACQSGRCATPIAGYGYCAAKLANGQTCMSPSDCVSGACTGDTSLCSVSLADGAACGYSDASCASKSCYTPDNQTSGTSPGVCGPKLDKAVGASCAQGYECASQVCREDKCWERICRRY